MQALLELADRTPYAEPLRKEAAEALSTHGLNRKGIEDMPLADSFIKESIRLHPMGCSKSSFHHRSFYRTRLINTRCAIVVFPLKATKPITFSDGTYIPEGTFISTPLGVYYDEEFYENPHTFDGFRFATPAAETGLSNTSTSYLAFGHGKHTW